MQNTLSYRTVQQYPTRTLLPPTLLTRRRLQEYINQSSFFFAVVVAAQGPLRVKESTPATVEVHHFFSEVLLNLGAQDLSQETDLENNQNCYIPDEKYHGLVWYTTRIMQKKKYK